MRKIIIFLSIVLIISDISSAQNFSYFPLSVGNKWYFSQGVDNIIKLKLEIQKDTTLDDGYSYAKFNMYQINSDSNFVLLKDGYSYLRKENRKIIEYPNILIFDYDMDIGDTVYSFRNEPYPSVLDTTVIENVLGRNLSTFYFSFTQYDFYSYTDSIGFNTLWATNWNNWVPEYLLGCEIDGKIYGKIITAIENQKKLLTDFMLYQNYPNPFNPSTKINYLVPQTSFVTIKVFDMLGKEIVILVNEEKLAGSYEIEFDANNLSSGVYFYRMQSGDFTNTKKFVLIR